MQLTTTTLETLSVDGVIRHYRLHIPSQYNDFTPVPLMLSLHGFAHSSDGQEMLSQWTSIADREGFIIVYPDGTGIPRSWNAGMTPYVSNPDGISDDIKFLGALIDHLEKTRCVDRRRIYVNGWSNGGGMCNRMACEMSDRIAAVGTVAGSYFEVPGGCQPSRPIPIIAFHGDADPIVPYSGSDQQGTPDIVSWAANWAKQNGCQAEPTMIFQQGDVTGISWSGISASMEVQLYTIHTGGHTWPGGKPLPFFGKTSNDISASEKMWEFFKRYSLPVQTDQST